jgi:hypothetical protein
MGFRKELKCGCIIIIFPTCWRREKECAKHKDEICKICPDCFNIYEITSPKYEWHRLLKHFKFS